jgi:hypothetical protein
MKSIEGHLRALNATTRVFRRHHPWTWHEDRLAGGGRIVSIQNHAQKFHLRFESDAAGAFKRLFLGKPQSSGASEWLESRFPPRPFEPRRQETVLSEDCTWFDTTPGMMDASLAQCRTADGVALKEQRWARGWNQTLMAVRLQRRPVDLTEVMPPPELLKPETWGLP